MESYEFTKKEIKKEFKETELGKRINKTTIVWRVVAVILIIITFLVSFFIDGDIYEIPRRLLGIDGDICEIPVRLLGLAVIILVYYDGKRDGAIAQFKKSNKKIYNTEERRYIMFCQNCGKEIDDKAVVCINCGVATNNFSNLAVNNEEVSEDNSRGVTSMVLGILAIFWALIMLAGTSELEVYTFGDKMATLFGLTFMQLACAIISLCLAVSERRKHKTGYNTSGLWLSMFTIALVIIDVIMVLTY